MINKLIYNQYIINLINSGLSNEVLNAPLSSAKSIEHVRNSNSVGCLGEVHADANKTSGKGAGKSWFNRDAENTGKINTVLEVIQSFVK